MMEALLARAAADASVLTNLVEGGPAEAPVASAPAEKTEEKAEEAEKEEDEEAGLGGLSAMFG